MHKGRGVVLWRATAQPSLTWLLTPCLRALKQARQPLRLDRGRAHGRVDAHKSPFVDVD
jgi:hypothetical protein